MEIFAIQRQPEALVTVGTYHALRLLSLARVGFADAAAKALSMATHLPLTRATPRDYVRSQWLMGAAHRALGNLPKAESRLNDSLTSCRRIKLVEMEADILLDLARLCIQTGDLAEARHLTQDALTITERCGYVLQGADVHLLLAQLDLDENRRDSAREHAAEARRLATCDGPPDYTYKVAYDEAEAMLTEIDAAP